MLLNNGSYSNAYYLSGYAVEIGLKACIARQIAAETLPDKSFIMDVFNQGHNLQKLVSLAGLARELTDRKNVDPIFSANWAIALEWRPDCRYETMDMYQTQLMLGAIGDQTSGVLQWIKNFW